MAIFIATGELASVSCERDLAHLLDIKCTAKLNFALMDPAQKNRIGNAIYRGYYGGIKGGNVCLFKMLCAKFRIPYVLRGTNEGFYPVRPECVADFKQEASAAVLLTLKDSYQSGTAYKMDKFKKSPAEVTGKKQHSEWPTLKVLVPDTRWDIITTVHDKYKPPRNDAGINAAIGMLVSGDTIEFPITPTEDYKGSPIQ